MALDMAIKTVIAIAQRGFDRDAYHEIMRATARKNIITFPAALLKTGAVGDKVVAAMGDAIPLLANAGVLHDKVVACDDADKELLNGAAETSDENIFVDAELSLQRAALGMISARD